METQYVRDTDPAFIKGLLDEIRLNNRRMIELSRRDKREKSKQAVVDWLNTWHGSWDIACCWHVSKHLRDIQEGDAAWLQRQLSAYFKKLHQHVYAHIPYSQRPQLQRFITLEYSHSVGWHAHGIISKPDHMTSDQFMAMMRKIWLKHAGKGCTKAFKERMCWFQPLNGAYQHYMLKHAINLYDDAPQAFRGFIDLHNTHRA